MRVRIHSTWSALAFLVLVAGLVYMPPTTVMAQEPSETPAPPPDTPAPPPNTPAPPPETPAPPETPTSPPTTPGVPTATPGEQPPAEEQPTTQPEETQPTPPIMPVSGGEGVELTFLSVALVGIGVLLLFSSFITDRLAKNHNQKS